MLVDYQRKLFVINFPVKALLAANPDACFVLNWLNLSTNLRKHFIQLINKQLQNT